MGLILVRMVERKLFFFGVLLYAFLFLTSLLRKVLELEAALELGEYVCREDGTVMKSSGGTVQVRLVVAVLFALDNLDGTVRDSYRKSGNYALTFSSLSLFMSIVAVFMVAFVMGSLLMSFGVV